MGTSGLLFLDKYVSVALSHPIDTWPCDKQHVGHKGQAGGAPGTTGCRPRARTAPMVNTTSCSRAFRAPLRAALHRGALTPFWQLVLGASAHKRHVQYHSRHVLSHSSSSVQVSSPKILPAMNFLCSPGPDNPLDPILLSTSLSDVNSLMSANGFLPTSASSV